MITSVHLRWHLPRLLPLLSSMGFALGSAAVLAQDAAWPTRNVQIVVPYTPGTGADILSRVMAPRLSERWKVGVVTDNRPGATGNIGADFVAKAAPDGHVLLFTATSFGTNPALSPNMPFDPIKSFAPVSLVATGALGLVINAQVPAKSMKEFVALVKKQPGRLNYSSPGNGGPQHLAMELLKLDQGMFIVHIPYRAAAGAVTDVVGGQVQAMVSALQTVAPHVASGKLRMLGVMSPVRAPAFPDIPTMREQGLPNVEVDTWYGVFAPAGTPPAVVAKVNAELGALLKIPEIRDVLAKQGLDPVGSTPEQFAARLRQDIPRWVRVVNAAGIKAD
jgi:tripartite-type tricarboxylate transporter receptor subunit TctC